MRMTHAMCVLNAFGITNSLRKIGTLPNNDVAEPEFVYRPQVVNKALVKKAPPSEMLSELQESKYRFLLYFGNFPG